MERASSAQHEELSLELTLAAVVPPEPGPADGFFLCLYCDRRFRSSQALAGHQNAHKQERAIANRRRETAASAVARARDVLSSVSGAWKAGRAAAAAATTWMREPGKRGGCSSERDEEVDLSLRL